MSEQVHTEKQGELGFERHEVVVHSPLGGEIKVWFESSTTATIIVDDHSVLFSYENGTVKVEVLPACTTDSDNTLSVDHPRIRQARTHIEQLFRNLQEEVPTDKQFEALGLDPERLRKDAGWQEFLEKRRAGEQPEED